MSAIGATSAIAGVGNSISPVFQGEVAAERQESPTSLAIRSRSSGLSADSLPIGDTPFDGPFEEVGAEQELVLLVDPNRILSTEVAGADALLQEEELTNGRLSPVESIEKQAEKISELVDRFEAVLEQIDDVVDSNITTPAAHAQRALGSLISSADQLFDGIVFAADQFAEESQASAEAESNLFGTSESRRPRLNIVL